MSIAVVTSFSAAGYQQYGRRFVETFHEFWPKEIDLFIVSEDDFPTIRMPNKPTGTTWCVPLQHSGGWLEFCDKHKSDPRVARVRQRPVKAFRYDAWKFSKKVFATQLAASSTTATRLLWLDADVFTYAPVSASLFDGLPPSHLAVSYLDRGAYHSECGFVGYNLGHPMTRKFIDKVAAMYSSGDVFTLDQWQDCFVFDHVRKNMVGLPCHQIPHNSRSQPFINSVLGKYMDHLKGNSKKVGASPTHPYRKPPSSVRRK